MKRVYFIIFMLMFYLVLIILIIRKYVRIILYISFLFYHQSIYLNVINLEINYFILLSL